VWKYFAAPSSQRMDEVLALQEGEEDC